MKKTLFSFIFLMLLALYCNAQNCNQKNNIQKEYSMEEIMKIPEINADYEFFDNDTFFFAKGSLREHKKRIVDNDTVDCYATDNRYQEYDKYKRMRRTLSRPYHGEVTEGDYSINPLIGIYKEFYKNGGIRVKGVTSWLGFAIGLMYYYDEEGNLIRTENHDEGFDFTIREIFSYCINNNISLERQKHKGWETQILKSTSANKSFWYIKYSDFTKGVGITIEIDAKTGEVTRIIEAPFVIGE